MPVLGLVGLLMLAPVLLVLSWALLLLLGLAALLIVAAAAYFGATGQVAAGWQMAAGGVVALAIVVLLQQAGAALWRRLSHPYALLLPLDRLRESDAAWFGAKAARLGALSRCGVQIPQGFAINGRLHARCRDKSRGATADFQIPRVEMRRIIRAYKRRVGRGPAMVRSSFGHEDQFGGSASGVFRSVHIERMRELEHAIVSVWSSAFSDRARSLAFRGLPENLGVFVHKQAGGEWIGRLLTADPASGSPDSVTIEACPGEIYEPSRAQRLAVTPRSLAAIDVPGLSRAMLQQLIELGLSQADKLKSPVELEWCVGDESGLRELRLLQVRPAPRKLSGRLWVNSGAVELISEPLSPLGRELIQRHFSVEQHIDLPPRLLGLGRVAAAPHINWIDGRPYLDAELIGHLYRLGRRSALSPRRIAARLRFEGRIASWPARLEKLRAKIDAALASPAHEPLTWPRVQNLAELVYNRAAALHAEGSLLADQTAGAFGLLADRWGVEARDLLRQALAAAPGNRLNDWRAARQQLDSAPEAERPDRLETYLIEWGHRTAGEAEISNPRPLIDPACALADPPPPERGMELVAALKLLRKRCAHLTAGHLIPWERNSLAAALKSSVLAAPMRENAKDLLLRGMAGLRRWLLRHGRALAESGALTDADDVFLFTLEELRRSFEAEPPTLGVLQQRREQLAAWRKTVALPALIETADGELHRPGEGWRGIMVSPGVARGRVAHAGAADAGSVLVLHSPDVVNAGDLRVAAVVCQTGSALCHLGQLCRELGVPMLVAVGDCMFWPVGARVEVDGWSGSARLIAVQSE